MAEGGAATRRSETVAPSELPHPDSAESAVEALERMLRGGYMTAQVIHTAVRTGLVDSLATDASDASEIAHRECDGGRCAEDLCAGGFGPDHARDGATRARRGLT
jgi:hypothetical protein